MKSISKASVTKIVSSAILGGLIMLTLVNVLLPDEAKASDSDKTFSWEARRSLVPGSSVIVSPDFRIAERPGTFYIELFHVRSHVHNRGNSSVDFDLGVIFDEETPIYKEQPVRGVYQGVALGWVAPGFLGEAWVTIDFSQKRTASGPKQWERVTEKVDFEVNQISSKSGGICFRIVVWSYSSYLESLYVNEVSLRVVYHLTPQSDSSILDFLRQNVWIVTYTSFAIATTTLIFRIRTARDLLARIWSKIKNTLARS